MEEWRIEADMKLAARHEFPRLKLVVPPLKWDSDADNVAGVPLSSGFSYSGIFEPSFHYEARLGKERPVHVGLTLDQLEGPIQYVPDLHIICYLPHRARIWVDGWHHQDDKEGYHWYASALIDDTGTFRFPTILDTWRTVTPEQFGRTLYACARVAEDYSWDRLMEAMITLFGVTPPASASGP